MRIARKLPKWMIIAGPVLALACGIHPVHNRMLAAGFLAGVFVFWLGCLLVLSGRPGLRLLVAAAPLAAILPFALPGKPLPSGELRAAYLSGMRSFDGTRYLWGGEGRLGIDCSGLPRRALRDALWAEGWKHANGRAFRMWLDLWCHDSSARAMSRGYRGRTRPLHQAGPLWELADRPILPGDLAIRTDGVHVVVYLGDGEWIEADPTWGRVHIWRAQASDGPWYEPMTLHRWVSLD